MLRDAASPLELGLPKTSIESPERNVEADSEGCFVSMSVHAGKLAFVKGRDGSEVTIQWGND